MRECLREKHSIFNTQHSSLGSKVFLKILQLLRFLQFLSKMNHRLTQLLLNPIFLCQKI